MEDGGEQLTAIDIELYVCNFFAAFFVAAIWNAIFQPTINEIFIGNMFLDILVHPHQATHTKFPKYLIHNNNPFLDYVCIITQVWPHVNKQD